MKSARRSGRALAACLTGASVALCSACLPIQHHPRLSVLSNQSIDLEKVDLQALDGQPVTGSSTTFSILGVLPIGKPRIEAAVGQALAKRDADLLTNVTVRHQESWAVLLGWETITVEGTAVKTLAERRKEQKG